MAVAPAKSTRFTIPIALAQYGISTMANLRRCGKFICVTRFAIVDILQPVPEKTRLEMGIGMQNDILDGHHKFLFKWLI